VTRQFYTIPDFGPNDLLTSPKPGIRRVQVDVAETGFFDGREFRISEELDLAAGEVRVYRFTSPIDFILQRQTLSLDDGEVKFTAYRSDQGTEGGTWGPVNVYGVNIMSTAPAYTGQASVDMGGTFTPNDGEQAVETIRLRTSGSTAQRTTVSGAVGDQRGLAAGTYYLVLDAAGLGGNAPAAGVFDLKYEERPEGVG